ncbi:MAG: chemotaxis protein CheD [Desulfobacteraceae bacterium 4572_19]|nr:MAG: chemotaxis protein CheD [Desulfobacteraceae bacterium 4572_19]
MRLIVGVSDMKVSQKPDDIIVTHSLGSCIGVIIYDPVVKAGGMLHYMLPESGIDKEKALNRPYMFADTGIPILFKSSYKLGAVKQRMNIVVVGGAQILDQKGFFNIGKRNYVALKKMFFKNNVMINYEEVGGNVNRTVKLEIATGDIFIKTSGKKERKI